MLADVKTKDFGTHSMRRGFTVSAMEQEVDPDIIENHGRWSWRSHRMVKHYGAVTLKLLLSATRALQSLMTPAPEPPRRRCWLTRDDQDNAQGDGGVDALGSGDLCWVFWGIMPRRISAWICHHFSTAVRRRPRSNGDTNV